MVVESASSSFRRYVASQRWHSAGPCCPGRASLCGISVVSREEGQNVFATHCLTFDFPPSDLWRLSKNEVAHIPSAHIPRSASLLSYPCRCRICIVVVESAARLSNPCCCSRTRVVRLSSLNPWRCNQTQIVCVGVGAYRCWTLNIVDGLYLSLLGSTYCRWRVSVFK